MNCCEAVVAEAEVRGKNLTVERQNQRAVSMANNVDEAAAVDAGITMRHHPLLVGVLDEQKVIFEGFLKKMRKTRKSCVFRAVFLGKGYLH